MGPEADNLIPMVSSQLTRNIGALYPEIKDEISTAFHDVLDLTGNGEHPALILVHYYECVEQPEWKSVPGLNSVQKVVCRTSNRAFVGLPLCEHSHGVPFIWFLFQSL